MNNSEWNDYTHGISDRIRQEGCDKEPTSPTPSEKPLTSYCVSYRFENDVTTGIEGACYVLASTPKKAREIAKQWLLNNNPKDTIITFPCRTLKRVKPEEWEYIDDTSTAPWVVTSDDTPSSPTPSEETETAVHDNAGYIDEENKAVRVGIAYASSKIFPRLTEEELNTIYTSAVNDNPYTTIEDRSNFLYGVHRRLEEETDAWFPGTCDDILSSPTPSEETTGELTITTRQFHKGDSVSLNGCNPVVTGKVIDIFPNFEESGETAYAVRLSDSERSHYNGLDPIEVCAHSILSPLFRVKISLSLRRPLP